MMIHQDINELFIDEIVAPFDFYLFKQPGFNNHVQIFCRCFPANLHRLFRIFNFGVWMGKQIVQQVMPILSAEYRS